MTHLIDRFVGDCAYQDSTNGDIHFHGVHISISDDRAGFRLCDGEGGHPLIREFDSPEVIQVFTEFIACLRHGTEDDRQVAD